MTIKQKLIRLRRMNWNTQDHMTRLMYGPCARKAVAMYDAACDVADTLSFAVNFTPELGRDVAIEMLGWQIKRATGLALTYKLAYLDQLKRI